MRTSSSSGPGRGADWRARRQANSLRSDFSQKPHWLFQRFLQGFHGCGFDLPGDGGIAIERGSVGQSGAFAHRRGAGMGRWDRRQAIGRGFRRATVSRRAPCGHPLSGETGCRSRRTRDSTARRFRHHPPFWRVRLDSRLQHVGPHSLLRRIRQHPPLGREEQHRPVRARAHLDPALVDRAVVPPAQQHCVSEARLAPVRLVLHVMRFRKLARESPESGIPGRAPPAPAGCAAGSCGRDTL